MTTEKKTEADESISAPCAREKKDYTECFQSWYSTKFLKGQFTPECESEFQAFRDCMVTSMEKKGIRKMVDEELQKIEKLEKQ
ncbi:mitochondrial distribution and morphology protein 35 (Mdm35) [Andalucia godoyi]|uniref:Mitochondrial distribution and morphology protein 35 (Mdm35) n=1 Tax=Andalucia godoyi TaxID=505711 RepID=A0A8K0F0V7_ANDGO|nr:mitochondrial distribution and morphology protein 35 (Mdm35) [Andalucia godoyi]|eukprot:ANDGO_08777.mRNA.1 mitochondrial distribution and morphology protein 35 (Mdm35)